MGFLTFGFAARDFERVAQLEELLEEDVHVVGDVFGAHVDQGESGPRAAQHLDCRVLGARLPRVVGLLLLLLCQLFRHLQRCLIYNNYLFLQ